MPQHKDVRSAGERVENLISELHAVPDPRVGAAAEELVRTLVDLYGEGLAHVMHIAAGSANDSAGTANSAKSTDRGDDGGVVGQLIADPLVAVAEIESGNIAIASIMPSETIDRTIAPSPMRMPPSLRSVTISPQLGSDFMNCSTAARRPLPTARITRPKAAVDLPLPSPV